MAEYDVNEILKNDGFDDIDLGSGQSIEFSKLDDLIEAKSNKDSWAKRIIDTSNSGFFQIATYVSQKKGGSNRKHYHPDTDEWWVVLKGTVEFEIGDNGKRHIAEPGDIVFCKKGICHKITTVSDDPAVRLSIAVDNQETITV
ncbi:uncharacterized protein METZ01_LOCUS404026 [marine metagenome]|uniref:Cupin type-2 domain-containing protein n=1 Tax=marine metagenome TaxID=408172 RepID=A0A382VXB5_9ZZZZ